MLQDIVKQYNGVEVSAIEVYSDIFKLGEHYIQSYNKSSQDLKANPLAYWKNDNATKGHYRVMFEDTFEETLKELQQADFSILNGISYFGRRNTQEHASKMYAMIFDVDGVTDESLNAFFSGAFNKDWNIYPLPNYVALSGHGVHLYYVFDNPIPLYPNIKIQLKAFKYALTDKMWNKYTSELENKQYQGINQGFRVIGGNTKIDGVKVTAYRFNTHPYNLKQLGEYIPVEYRVDETKLFKESKITLEQAKEKYPLWYDKVINGNNKKRKKWDIADKVNGNNPYALYDWWKKQIELGATFHHRYFSIMCLAIYGVKNGVDYETVKKDAYSYIPFMNAIAPDNPFRVADVNSALECYDDRYATFPISDIEKLSDIHIEKNKRNGLKQSQHLTIARTIKQAKKSIGVMKAEGRPNAQETVTTWRTEHPNGIKAQCIKDTGLDKKTVYKWW